MSPMSEFEITQGGLVEITNDRIVTYIGWRVG